MYMALAQITVDSPFHLHLFSLLHLLFIHVLFFLLQLLLFLFLDLLLLFNLPPLSLILLSLFQQLGLPFLVLLFTFALQRSSLPERELNYAHDRFRGQNDGKSPAQAANNTTRNNT